MAGDGCPRRAALFGSIKVAPIAHTIIELGNAMVDVPAEAHLSANGLAVLRCSALSAKER